MPALYFVYSPYHIFRALVDVQLSYGDLQLLSGLLPRDENLVWINIKGSANDDGQRFPDKDLEVLRFVRVRAPSAVVPCTVDCSFTSCWQPPF